MCYPQKCFHLGKWSIFLILPGILPVNVSTADSLESVQDSARKWIEIRLETSQLESDWAWQKDLLQSMEQSLSFRVGELGDREALLLAQTATQREAVEQSREQVARLRADLAVLENDIGEVVQTLQDLRAFFPPSLSDSLELAFKSLEDPSLSLGERMQLVVTVLNRCQQFNDMISCREETIGKRAEGSQKVMSVIYWGLSHAYALDRSTGDTFLGQPGEAGWTWTPRDGIEPEVRKLIEVFNEETDPVLVKAPVRVIPGEAR